MAKTKAPLSVIRLCTLMAIEDKNNIGNTENNKTVLKQFKQMRPTQKYTSAETMVICRSSFLLLLSMSMNPLRMATTALYPRLTPQKQLELEKTHTATE